MSEAIIDWERPARTGLREAILCEGKSTAHIRQILSGANDRPLLLTRLSPEQVAELSANGASLDYDEASRTAFVGAPPAAVDYGVVIVMAGLGDIPTGREAERTLAFNGIKSAVITDVGVAGLWRLMARLEDLKAARLIIAVAGMEGALFSVLGGLVAAPIVACPSPVGYGVSAGGQTALMSALSSCADGVLVTNIGNGYGAACAAMRILRTNGAREPSSKAGQNPSEVGTHLA
ncbi:MAG: nickel pincer cofactor biosynthesis protein LarB [Pseudomonadota bacterium]